VPGGLEYPSYVQDRHPRDFSAEYPRLPRQLRTALENLVPRTENMPAYVKAAMIAWRETEDLEGEVI
jgi:hypothetical protein